MQPVSVHIAVLSVAKDPKHPDHNAIAAAIERATSAGHKVVEQATVKDSEPAVREQLTRWITDSNVDVVLVLGGADSDTASSAMKPLVSSVLPGFTDLFRWLAFQEVGASAMLSQAEAAQCGQAYVFVLPGAIGAAMDKLILPQLDPNTTPKNLVSSLPRLQSRAAEAVPTAIHGEKTQGGAGLPPKLPALPARKQSKTGANVIPRRRAVDDPPTKPIDLERLEKEIARSEANDQSTRRTDLAKLLPKLPPGADEYLEPDADEDLTDAELLAAPPPPGMRGPKKPQSPAERARHEAATPPAPTPIVVPPAALKPGSPAVPAVIPPITQGPRRPPTQPPPAPQRPASSPTTAGGIPPRTPAQIPSLVKPGAPPTTPLPSIAKSASPGATALAAAWSKPADEPKREPKVEIKPRASTEPRNGGAWLDAKTEATPPKNGGAKTTPAGSATPAAGTPKITSPGRPTPPGGTPPRPPAAPNGPVVDTKTLPIARVATPVTGAPASEIVGRPLATPAAGTPATDIAARVTATPAKGTPSKPTNGASTSTITASSVAAAPAAEPVSANPRTAATTTSAEATAKTAATSKTPTSELDPSELRDESLEEIEPASNATPAPMATAAPSPRAPTPPPTPAVRTRQPTPPPLPAVKVPAAEPIVVDSPSPRTSASDLPRGTFTYPVQRKKTSVAVKLLALACAAGLGFVAVVYLLPMVMGNKDEPAPTRTAEVTPPTPPPPVETPAAGSGSDVAPVEPPPDEPPPVETPPVETPPVETPPDKLIGKPAQRPTSRAGHTQAKPAGDPDDKPTPKAETRPASKPAAEPPVEDDGCDETSCILSKYEKACCEKYKPKASDLSARTGGGLPEDLDKMMVRAGVEKVKPRVVACGEKAAVKGTVRISMTVSPAGAVTSAEVAETPDAGLGTCVLAAMKAASFGKSVNGGTFTYPFAF